MHIDGIDKQSVITSSTGLIKYIYLIPLQKLVKMCVIFLLLRFSCPSLHRIDVRGSVMSSPEPTPGVLLRIEQVDRRTDNADQHQGR